MFSAEAISAGPVVWEHPAAFGALLLGGFLLALGTLTWTYRPQGRGAAMLLVLCGAGLLMAGVRGARVVSPVAVNYFAPTASLHLPQLDQAARSFARRHNRPVLYYFRADWCAHCPDFERYRLMNPLLAPVLRDFVVVKMDLSDFARWKAFVATEYGVHGTPSLAFRDASGRRLAQLVVEGDDLSVGQLKSLLLTVRAAGRLPEGRAPAGTPRPPAGRVHVSHQLPHEDLHWRGTPFATPGDS